MTNTNNHITLLAKLGIDTTSKNTIQDEINDLAKKLKGITINININESAIKTLEKLANFDFSKLKNEGKSTGETIEKALVKSAKEYEEAIKKAEEKLGFSFKNTKKQMLTDAEDIKASLSKKFPNVKVNFDIIDAEKKIKGIVAQFEKNGITTRINFEQVKVGDNAALSPAWIPKNIQETDKQLSIAAKSVQTLITQMNKLQNEGKLTNQQFEQLVSKIKNADEHGGIKGLTAQMDQFVLGNKRATEAIKERDRLERESANALRNQETSQEKIISNENKRKSLVLDIQRLLNGQSRTLDVTAAKELQNQVRNMDATAKNFATVLSSNKLALKELSVEAATATRNNMGLMDSFRVAMTRFPVWMAATTIFYSSIRIAREFMRIIIDIDTKLTSLAKVMSDDTDLGQVFDRATASAERFGQSISQVLDAYVEFARQGFKNEDLEILSNAGLIAANVGEITAQQAAEYMTASLVQWKMDVQDGMKIIDSWNEISNNYSTTLEKLAQGHARAGAAASAMNLSFSQTNAIIGSLTAATKQSGTEIGNFLKTALPRLVGQPAQDALGKLGVSLGDENGNLRDVIEVYTEVAEKVKDLNEMEKIAITEGLAGKYHITRMQILLDDLGSVDSMYRQMYDTSINSAGSANEENERYMKSLQARINLSRVEVEKLAVSMGQAFVTEGLIHSLQGFNALLGVLGSLTNVIGGLPIILSTVGFAAALLFTRVSALSGSLALSTANFIANKASGNALGATLTVLTAKVAALGMATRALLIATGVGAALVVLGFGVEWLLRMIGKHRETSEAIAQQNRELTDAYNSNRDSVKSLANEYSELSEKMKDASPEERLKLQMKYTEVQNQLASLMPDFIAYEDSYGDSVLQSSTIINAKLKLLESQLQIEERIAQIEKEKAAAVKLETSKDTIKSSQKDAEKALKNFDNTANNYEASAHQRYGREIKSVEDMTAAIITYENKQAKALEAGQKRIANNYGKTAQSLRDLLSDYQYATTQIDAANLYIAQRSIEDAEKVISAHESMSESAKELSINMMSDFVLGADSSTEMDIFANVFKSAGLQKALDESSTIINKFINSTEEEFTANREVLEKYGETLKTALSSNLRDSNGKKLAADSTEVQNAEKALEDYILKLIIQEAQIRNVAAAEDVSLDVIRSRINAVGEVTESYEGQAEAIEKYVQSLIELSDATDRVAGISKKQIADVEELIFTYQNLNNAKLLTQDQTIALAEAEEVLARLYPHLVNEGELRIESITAERQAQEILWNAVEASKKNQLTAEEETTINQLKETNIRIGLINSNIEALNQLAEAYGQLQSKAQAKFDIAKANYDIDPSNVEYRLALDNATRGLMHYSQQAGAARSQLAELATLEDARTKQLTALNGALERVEESSKSSSKSSSDSSKESVYITDKYAVALEAVSFEIEKQVKLRANMTEHSTQYRSSLQAEIKLEQSKKKLLEEQAAALEKQIKSGKIQQTGSISSSSSKSLSGWSGSITSDYGFRNDPINGARKIHGGVDIRGAIGTRLDANVSGKVIASGNSKQTGYDSSYGNIVVVKDDDGNKHLYAHLDKAIAKLGDTITAGMQVGTIGNTGRTNGGSHLHYEVRNSSNKAVNPNSYLNAAQSGTTSSGSSIATGQQAIDKAKSDLLKIKSDILATDETIKNLQLDYINSELEKFSKARETYQRVLDYENEKIKSLDITSARYGKTIERNVEFMKKAQAENEKELKYIQGLINGGTLSAKVLEEMKIRAEQLKVEMMALDNSIDALSLDKINGAMVAFDEEIDDIEYLIQRSQALSGLMDEGSADYNTEVLYQIGLLKQNQEAITRKRKALEKLIATERLNATDLKAYKEQLEDLSLAYWNLSGTIKSTEDALEESNKNYAENAANTLITAYKDYLAEKRDAHMRALDAEAKAEDRRHKQVMDNYKAEMDTYRKSIQDKLDNIDKEESEYDYAKEMDELEKERLEILRKINLLSLDQSSEAKAERKKLNEELAKLDDNIADKQRKKEIEDRKENLNNLLDDKEEEMAEKERLENLFHDNQKNRIDDLRTYWTQFYTDQLNDERKFAKMKEDIIAGNFDNLSAEFQAYIKEMEDTMPELNNTLDGTMKAVGTSIRQNIIENLREALKMLAEVQNGSQHNTSGQAGSSFAGNGSTSSTTLNRGDAQVLTGKVLVEMVALQTKDAALQAQIKNKGYSLAATGRAAGSTISADVTLASALSKLTKEQQKQFGQYLLSTGVNTVSTPALQEFIKKYGNQLASLSTGGYTGNNEGIGILHEKEVILNKKETKDFFKYAPILETLSRLINPLKMPTLRQPELVANPGVPSISLEFNIDKMIANETTAKNLAQTVLSEVSNTLKRERGIR